MVVQTRTTEVFSSVEKTLILRTIQLLNLTVLTPEHVSVALPRCYRCAIAHASSNQTTVNYEEWDVLEVGYINLSIINTSVQIENASRIASFASGNASLHR